MTPVEVADFILRYLDIRGRDETKSLIVETLLKARNGGTALAVSWMRNEGLADEANRFESIYLKNKQ